MPRTFVSFPASFINITLVVVVVVVVFTVVVAAVHTGN